MRNSFFQFKQFTIHQQRAAMKVTTDSCLFGAWTAKKIAYGGDNKNILDIGAGTGLLSLMIAQKTKAPIDAIEIEADAYEQAMENIKASQWDLRVRIIHNDIKKTDLDKSYSSIVSNPPFYENELQSPSQQKNIAHHHDALKLDELITVIEKNLSADGNFYLLLPYKRKEAIERSFSLSGLHILETVRVRQTINHDFFRLMIRGGFKNDNLSAPAITEMAIKNENDQYIPEFIALLRDYYLHL